MFYMFLFKLNCFFLEFFGSLKGGKEMVERVFLGVGKETC